MPTRSIVADQSATWSFCAPNSPPPPLLILRSLLSARYDYFRTVDRPGEGIIPSGALDSSPYRDEVQP
jgi:hypothetical protein